MSAIGKPPYRRGSKKTSDFKVGILDGKPSIQVNWGGRIYGSPLALVGAGNELATQRFGNLHASGFASFGSGIRVGPDSTSKSALRVASDGALSIGKKGATANFSVTSAGVVSITGAITATSGTFNGDIAIGSGDAIFKADSNGIYLGDATFGDAEFRVTPAGALTATSSTVTGTINATSGSSYTGNSIAVAYTAATDDTAADAAQTAIDAMEAQVVLGDTQIDIMTQDQSPSDFKLARFGSTIYLYDGTANENVKLEIAAAGVKMYGDNATTYAHVDSNGLRLYDTDPDDAGSAVLSATFQGGGAVLGRVVNDKSRLVLTGGALQFVHRTGDSDIVTAQLTAAGVFNVANINLTGKINVTSAEDRNVCIGTWSSGNPDVGDDNVVIGTDAGNAMAAYGGQDPIQNIYIGSGAASNARQAQYNIGIGYNSFPANVGGGINIAIGASSGTTLNGGTGCVYIGTTSTASGTSVDNEVAIGGWNVSGVGVLGQGANSVTLGQNLTSNVYMSEDNGAKVWCTDIDSTSDSRIKKNVNQTSLGLEFINKLNPVIYNMRKHSEWDEDLKSKQHWYINDRETRDIDDTELRIGFIAQEVKEALGSVDCNIHTVCEAVNNKDVEGLDYVRFVVPLTKAVQELSAKFDNMDERLTNLEVV